MIISPVNNKISFKSIFFEDFNKKYDYIRNKLNKETEDFFQKRNNVTKIGEGIGGETFRFNDYNVNNLVIKTTKSNYNDDYATEFKNLMSVPSNIIGGQEAVARVYDNQGKKHGLISTFVQGKPASVTNCFNDAHLKSLFNKMYELDKVGIYHGDLNGNNILLNSFGTVNFIDYQWTKIISIVNFFDIIKASEMLLPRTVFPENAQMFEMASLPYYIDKLPTASEKENFLKKYLLAKSEYHNKRAKYIAEFERYWNSYEKPIVRKSLQEEQAKASIFKHPDDLVIKMELKKLQFLSDYRDAYSHVDKNLPDRNIIPSTSSYLCAMSAVQDLRRDISHEQLYIKNDEQFYYLRSMQVYTDYWYDNLKQYTSDTFDYVMRAIMNKPSSTETKHEFYENERNPREITPNRDILANVSQKYRTIFDNNFSVPNNLNYTISSMYDNAASSISSNLSYDTKSLHNIDKIRSVSKESKIFNDDLRYLDLLNVSQVGLLKIREFYSYVKHNISSSTPARAIADLLQNSEDFTKQLFKTMYNSVKQDDSNWITKKGYIGMRQFKAKI